MDISRTAGDGPLTPSSHPEKIRSAFLAKALACHPDLVPEAPLDAFRTLCHQFEKARWLPVYLWTGEREVEVNSYSPDWDSYTLQDALHTFALAIEGLCGTHRPGDVVVQCRIELRDVFLGSYKTLSLPREVECACQSRGDMAEGDVCPLCGGKGVRHIEERINFEVPPGSTSGNLAYVIGKGNYDLEKQEYGDLFIVFHEVLPPQFRRQGVDCLCEAEPLVTVLALGGTAFTESPLGERVYFKVPPGTQSGRTITIPGQGFPCYRTRNWGNLLCRLIPRLPPLDRGEREIFLRLHDLEIQRGGIQYRTQGRFGVLIVRPENDSPSIADELVDLAVVLQASGLTPAVDLSALVPFASRRVLNALVAVYNHCFQRGQMKVLAHPEVAVALKNLQIGALFEVLVGGEDLEGRSFVTPPNPFQRVRLGKWEVYPMGANSLICDLLLSTPDLLENLEASGHLFKAYDLSQISQVDSFFIGKLIRVYKFVSSSGGFVALIGVSPSVLKVLEETGIRSLFRLVQSVDELPN
ncbi:MAG TPA: DnaJ C-terminal domain-containing protein [Fibrobacteraceae bacterium]|nr:DnaJ C-terminal domain-containing protein [Fibrobacteraceae bacterium]